MGTEARLQREVAAPDAWLASSGWGRDHGGWSSSSLTAGWADLEGPLEVPAGMGVRPSAAPAGSERSQLGAGSALTCDDGWWACQDLNLGPHPYQVSRAKRCADHRFPRSLATVRGQGMRSITTGAAKGCELSGA